VDRIEAEQRRQQEAARRAEEARRQQQLEEQRRQQQEAEAARQREQQEQQLKQQQEAAVAAQQQQQAAAAAAAAAQPSAAGTPAAGAAGKPLASIPVSGPVAISQQAQEWEKGFAQKLADAEAATADFASSASAKQDRRRIEKEITKFVQQISGTEMQVRKAGRCGGGGAGRE
jgi:hypothetical protein